MHTESSRPPIPAIAGLSRRMSTDADDGDCPTALTMSMATTPPCRFQQQLRIQHRRAHNRRQGAGTGNVAEGCECESLLESNGQLTTLLLRAQTQLAMQLIRLSCRATHKAIHPYHKTSTASSSGIPTSRKT